MRVAGKRSEHIARGEMRISISGPPLADRALQLTLPFFMGRWLVLGEVVRTFAEGVWRARG